MDNVDVNVTKMTYKRSERAIAAILLAVGYIFKLLVVDMNNTIGAVIGMYLLYGIGTVLMIVRGAKLNKEALIFYIPGAVMPLALVFTSSMTIGLLVRAYSAVAYAASVYYTFGNRIGNRFGDMMFFEVLKSLIVLPLVSLGEWFIALFQSKNGKNTAKTVLSAIAGLLFAVIPTFIVIALLSYDGEFSKVINNISFDDIFTFALNVVFAIAFSAVVFGDIIASSLHKADDRLASDKCADMENRAHIIPTPMLTAFVIPFLAVYAIFFASQNSYYISAFTGKFPENLSYATYARNGFFELCAVALINAIILAVIELFAKRSEGEKPMLTRVISSVYALVTLALVATAASKMVMYIGMYGLTEARVYASWFMILLAICFVILIISQIKKIRTLLAIFFAMTLMLGALAFCGVDARIAEYNVNAYLGGRLNKIDIDAMYDLSEDAVPYVLRLLDHDIDESLRNDIMKYADCKNYELKERHMPEMNAPRIVAAAKLSSIEIVLPPDSTVVTSESDNQSTLDYYAVNMMIKTECKIEEIHCNVVFGDSLLTICAENPENTLEFVINRSDIKDVPDNNSFILLFDAKIDGEYREIKGEIEIPSSKYGTYTTTLTDTKDGFSIIDTRYGWVSAEKY